MDSGNGDGPDWANSGPRLIDADITFDENANQTDNSVDVIEQRDREISFSIEFSLDLEQTVVCKHCGEVNGVPDGDFIAFLEFDPSCLYCGYPLGVVR